MLNLSKVLVDVTPSVRTCQLKRQTTERTELQ